jgi:queuine tRNA-ribosyltransferase
MRNIPAKSAVIVHPRFSRQQGVVAATLTLTWHNLTFYQDLMAGLRAAIRQGRLAGTATQIVSRVGHSTE